MKPPADTTPWDRSVMSLNAQAWTVRANIRNNIRRQLPQMRAHPITQERIAIVGGGWSLRDTEKELRDLVFSGVNIVALNGAANWCAERNLRPAMHVVLDSRPVNVDFFRHDSKRCKYYLASQCHPSAFEALEGRDVTVFHVISTDGDAEKKRLDEYYAKRWQQVPSSGTVGIVAIMLCRLLGFKFQHVFGLDSCYAPTDRAHHAYDQAWNDAEGAAPFWVAGREFNCSAWQASQCGEFVDLLTQIGNEVCLDIHGDGALAHILKTGANAAPLSSAKEA